MKKPRIMQVKTKRGNEYIYDACSNLIFASTDISLDIVHQYNLKKKEELIQNLVKKYKSSYKYINNYYNYIDSLIKKYDCFYSAGAKISPKSYNQHFFKKEIANVNQLILEVTQNCNFRCTYCVYSGNFLYSREHTEKSMTFEIARKSIDYYCDILFSHERTLKTKKTSVGFFGGEPFLEFSLIKKCVEYVKSKLHNSPYKILFLITTNGSIMNDNILSYLIENDIHVNISLDGPMAVHNRFRVFKNGKGTFDKVINNIAKIKNLNNEYFVNNIGFEVTVTKNHNLLEMKDFFDSSNYINKRNISVNQAWESDTKIQFKEDPNYEKRVNQLYSEFKSHLTTGKSYKSPFLQSFYNRTFSACKSLYYMPISCFKKYTYSCYPGCQKLFVSSDGDFHACEKINRHFPIGDYIKGIDLEKVTKVWNAYVSNAYKNCSKCESVYFCNNCLATAAKAGYFDVRSQCRDLKKSFQNLLSDFLSIKEENPDAFRI